MSECYKELKNNLSILERYYPICANGDQLVPIAYFINDGFNWDRYEKTTLYENKQLPVIGSYCYYVYSSKDDKKEIMIWKLIMNSPK